MQKIIVAFTLSALAPIVAKVIYTWITRPTTSELQTMMEARIAEIEGA